MAARSGWDREFEPTRLASLELRMWKAYYRRQPIRLFGLLVLASREQARASWPRAVLAAGWFAWAAARFGRAAGDYDCYLPEVARGYRALGLPGGTDAEEVARRELRWWVVRREIGLAGGTEAGIAITALYAAVYGVPEPVVAEAGRLRGEAAEIRDRGAAEDPDGSTGAGRAYWPEVARTLDASYRSLRAALDAQPADDAQTEGVARGRASAGAAANEYAFVTIWRLPATREEIAEILGDAAALPRWWPSVYLRATILEPGDERGLGKVVDLWTKGWLPYTLRWSFRVTESDPPARFALEASGDFVGRGVWRLDEEIAAGQPGGPQTLVEYDWRIRAEKGLLRRFSFLLKPLFSANHRWAMARGEESLRLEIARRHATADPAIATAIPPPPGPSFQPRFRRAERPG